MGTLGRKHNDVGLERRLRWIALLFSAVGIFVVLAVANTPLAYDEDFEGANRMALNVISALAAALAVATTFIPWRRLPRDAFFALPAAGTALISACVYFSGGWDSFAYGLYVLAAILFGLYFPAQPAVGFGVVALAGASPLLYEPDLLELAKYLVVDTPLLATATFVSGYVIRQVERKEAARRASEARLREERERTERLRRMAEIDALTGLWNRRHLEKRLAQELERSRRLGEGFALLFADLDDFKEINDEYGHLLGDDALRLVARTLEETSRQIDVVARYGGEEFVVLFPGTDPRGAAAFYERVREDLLRRSREELGLPVRLSAGAEGAESASNAEELLEAADRAMYEAKRRGKDQIFVREP